jgi:hypothetical protein
MTLAFDLAICSFFFKFPFAVGNMARTLVTGKLIKMCISSDKPMADRSFSVDVMSLPNW